MPADNWAIGNKLDGSHMHGVWGGYSARMVVLDNSIRDTLGGGVSIEHGQQCAIVGNVLTGNDVGVELWWDEDPSLVGGPFDGGGFDKPAVGEFGAVTLQFDVPIDPRQNVFGESDYRVL